MTTKTTAAVRIIITMVMMTAKSSTTTLLVLLMLNSETRYSSNATTTTTNTIRTDRHRSSSLNHEQPLLRQRIRPRLDSSNNVKQEQRQQQNNLGRTTPRRNMIQQEERRKQQQQQQRRLQQERRVTEKKKTLMLNGTFYTMNPDQPWADTILIDENGNIEQIWNDTMTDASVSGENVESIYYQDDSNAIEMIDLMGQLVLPGFHDVHIHAVEAGVFDDLCYIPEDTFVGDIPSVLKDCPNGALVESSQWIVGVGYDVGTLIADLYQAEYYSQYYNVPFPLNVLDDAYPDTPVLIIDDVGHAVLCNTQALTRVGYHLLTEDPPGGQLLRDHESGHLWGVILENAQQPLREAAFEGYEDIYYDLLLDSLYRLNANGITSVSDAGGFWRQTGQVESWNRVLDDHLLTVRASNALYVYPDMTIEEQLPSLIQLMMKDNNSNKELLRFDQAKIYVDGILSYQTSALKEPYQLEPSSYDRTFHNEEESMLGFEYFQNFERLLKISQYLVNEGFQLHYHATGDRGVALALDAIERLSNNSTTNSTTTTGPHRITHCYLIDEVDRSRFQQLGVVADFQLAPSSLDEDYIHFLSEQILGESRASQLLPAKEVYDAGAHVTISSDWDADVLSPMIKLQTILQRQPSERTFTDLKTILPMMTINGAKLMNQDNVTGSIEVGKYADLVVLNQNIFNIPVEQISTTKVSLTFLQGEMVYNSSLDEGNILIDEKDLSLLSSSASSLSLGRLSNKYNVPILCTFGVVPIAMLILSLF